VSAVAAGGPHRLPDKDYRVVTDIRQRFSAAKLDDVK
jgi:hypothetical protein